MLAASAIAAGLSMITVDILPKYSSAKLPQIWDELRKKIRDAAKEEA